MATDINKEIQLEIAYILFVDTVGYSKLSINEQHAVVDELTQIVRGAEQFQKAEAADRLIKISTGDGMAIAVRTLPNNARIFELSGRVDRRQGRWHDAVRNLEHAMELDPRNVNILEAAAVTYSYMRDYGQAKAIFDRIIALEPTYVWRACWIAFARADLRP